MELQFEDYNLPVASIILLRRIQPIMSLGFVRYMCCIRVFDFVVSIDVFTSGLLERLPRHSIILLRI